MNFERKEYPRPQFKRESWQPLNGEWEFEFDDCEDGFKRNLCSGKVALNGKILVPYSYQYEASGIGDTSVHEVVWYRRSFVIEAENMGKRAILNFNAADYQTEVWVNGLLAVTHVGGFSPFSADITQCLKRGENVIVVRCIDRQDVCVPRGKQSWTGKTFGCFYVANTGIWQSVWLDFIGDDGISNYSLLPDYDNRLVRGAISTWRGKATDLEIAITYKGELMAKQTVSVQNGTAEYCIVLPVEPQDYCWSPEEPRLFEVDFTLFVGRREADKAHTRFGIRKFGPDEHGTINLNYRPYYQKLILDQGYWKESGLTPPSAEAIKKDIELAKAMGFNGARKHQKFEDPYFYYYAEELGYLTWCEMPSAFWFGEKEMAALTSEWQAIVSIAKNQTSNVCYVPINESWGVKMIKTEKAQQQFVRSLYYLTKAIDGERMISTNDGYENINPSDMLAIHDYRIRKTEEIPAKYNGAFFDGMNPQGWPLYVNGEGYDGKLPMLLTEFGGISLIAEEKDGAWGYDESATDGEDLCKRIRAIYEGLAQTKFQGICYTQLTDVQQEINGLLRVDRTPKFDVEKMKKINEVLKA